MSLTILTLARAADSQVAHSGDDLDLLEQPSKVRVSFPAPVLPRVGFSLHPPHYSLFVGTAECTIFALCFNLAEPLLGVNGRDVHEIAKSEVCVAGRCWSFELIARTSKATYVCFGLSGRSLRLCEIPPNGSATAQDLTASVSLTRALSSLLGTTGGQIVSIRSYGSGAVVTVSAQGLLCVWDLNRRCIVCDTQVFTESCPSVLLEVSEDAVIAVGFPNKKQWGVSVYHLVASSLELVNEVPGGDEEPAALCVSRSVLFIRWKSERGSRLEAVALDREARVYTQQLQFDTDMDLDACVQDRAPRAVDRMRFSSHCISAALRRLGREGEVLDIKRVKTLDKSKKEEENVELFLEACTAVQQACLDSLDIAAAEDFPLVSCYDDDSIGVFVQPCALDAESLRAEELCNRFAALQEVDQLAAEVKVAGVSKLTLALALARVMRRRFCPLLCTESFASFAQAHTHLQDRALPPVVQSALLASLSPTCIYELEQRIQGLAHSEPKLPAVVRRSQWPAASLTLVANSVLQSIKLKNEYALDCLVLAGWLKAGTVKRLNSRIAHSVYISALHSAALFHSLSFWLSKPVEAKASVYAPAVSTLAVLLAAKSRRLFGSADEFELTSFGSWLSMTVSRTVQYVTSTDEWSVPRCCTGLLKCGQNTAVLGLLALLPRTTASVEFLRGLALERPAAAQKALCRGSCLLTSDQQFSGRPWYSQLEGDSLLFHYYEIVARRAQGVANVLFWEQPGDGWTHLFQLLVKQRRHSEAFTLLVSHDSDPALVEVWVREVLAEGSVAALQALPLHPEILSCVLEVLGRLCATESFDLQVTLTSPRYRNQSAALFQRSVTQVEGAGSMKAHSALFTLALSCLNYRLAAKTMYEYYEDISREGNPESPAEAQFVLRLQQEALLLCALALHSLSDAQAWFLTERSQHPRKLLSAAHVQRLLCTIKRQLDKRS